jgi:CheY-like chemotaxis protein
MGYRYFLFIDDDLDEHEIFQWALQAVSPEAVCHAFSDPEIAMRRIEDEGLKFDVVFVDLNMPKMNGFQFLEMAKNIDSLSRTPIYVLTNSSSPEINKKAAELGAAQLITKFSSIEPLMKLLSNFV